MQVFDELNSLSAEKRSIKVGLVGAGFMGKGVVEIVESVPAMNVVAISDIDIDRARECYELINFTHYREIHKREDADKVDFPKQRVITTDYRVVPQLDGVDFIVEATGVPEIGAEVAHASIVNKKHIGMMNVEADATIGYYLSHLARENGVVYTVCTGDEPAAVKELYDFAKTLGFTIVACGKGKNNPLDVTATPESLKERAEKIGLNPVMLTEFVDGSKTMVEMSCVANATGLTIDKRNMHGPHARIEELANVFCAEERGGILKTEGVVDYVIGDLAPGVFIVVRHDGKMANMTMRYLKMGEGPQFLLYRPYHLTSIEVPISIAMGYLFHKPALAQTLIPSTEVITIAKKDLKSGDSIDRIGGSTVYGGIEKFLTARREKLLPLGLSEGASLREDIERGSPITLDQVGLRESFLLRLRRLQDRLSE